MKGLQPNEDGSTTVPLRTPVKQANGNMLCDLTIPAKITVSQMEVMDEHKGENAKMRALIAELAGVSFKTLGKLDAADFIALSTEVGKRLEGDDSEDDGGGKESRRTGEIS